MHSQSSDSDSIEFFQFKIVVLGDGAVGKTSIINRFCEDYFAKSYKQTIGVDFFVKRIELPGDVQVAMQVWDIGGQSIFGKMIKTYIFEANAVLLVYDITNYESFLNLQDWLTLVKETFKGRTMPAIALVGNKTDLFHLQAIDLNKHKEFAKEHNLYSFFLSAKTGDQVNPTLYRIAATLAGVELKKGQFEVKQRPVIAEIVAHKRNEAQRPQAEAILTKSIAKEKTDKKRGGCHIF